MVPLLFWSTNEISKTIWKVRRHRKQSALSNQTPFKSPHSNPSASGTLPTVLFSLEATCSPTGTQQLSNQRHISATKEYRTSPRHEIHQGNPLPPGCGTDGLQSSGWMETEATLPHSSPLSMITVLRWEALPITYLTLHLSFALTGQICSAVPYTLLWTHIYRGDGSDYPNHR